MDQTPPDLDVRRIAALAHLELTDAEADLFARQLRDVLAYADAVQRVDTTGVPPTSHPLAGAAIWLLVTDPVAVSTATSSGDVGPLVRAFGAVLFDALRGLFAYL